MLLLLPPPWPARAPSAARAGRSPLRAPPACSALGGSALTAKPGASVEADASSPPASSPPPGCAAPPAEAAAAKRPIKLQLSQPRASPNKRLGQHFLQSLAVVDAAVAAAGVRPGDAVLEVGPGTGVLTRALLKAGASVVALEKDAALASLLADNNRALTASGRLTVVRDDALRWLRSPAFGAAFPAGRAGGAKVVANIPYAVTTELLSLLLPCGDRLASATLLVQEELAQRLFVQGPGVGQEAREMSLRVRFHAQPHYVRPVLRACFAPPPGVDSALVRLDLLPPEKWCAVESRWGRTRGVRPVDDD